MTAHAMQGDREKCLDAGMDDYVTKPLRMPDLEAALERWVPADDGSGPEHTAVNGNAHSAANGNGLNGNVPPNTEAVDRSALLALAEMDDGDGDLLRDLIELFLDQTPPQLAAVREASERGDAGGLREAAHALRGSSVTIGAGPMTELCRELEALGAAGKTESAGALVSRLEAAFVEVRAVLDAEITASR